MKIDAHIHAWMPSKRNDDILALKRIPELVRDAMPDDIEPILLKQGITSAVLIQSAPSLDHGHWCLDLAKPYDFIMAVMAWIDPLDPALAATLDTYASRSKLAGFRIMLNRLQDPTIATTAPFIAGVQSIVDRGFSIELLALPEHLQIAVSLVERVGRGRFVLDHCGQPDLKSGEIGDWRVDLAQLATHMNVTCKLSGLAERMGKDWTPERLVPIADYAIQTFGSERLLFASNWPICDLVGGMGNWCDGLDEILAILKLNEDEKDAIFFGTARSLWGY